ncbi:hypothetical protein [Bacillus sp. BHET2]|uniref:hypothetical protein n=1 Tax=Bacillus sp. BHET2 TaxID=2583818 RepID=UPI00148757A6|nr:hypothetical protein [Bacillus sp. BHET2]
MKRKFITTCFIIMTICSIMAYLLEDSVLGGIAFALNFFTMTALSIGIWVDEE